MLIFKCCTLNCELYTPCKHLARSMNSGDSFEDPSKFINSFKDPCRTKYCLQGSCEQIDSFQDSSRFIHSFSDARKDLTWNLSFLRILDRIHIFARTLHHLWSSFKVLRRFFQGFHFHKSKGSWFYKNLVRLSYEEIFPTSFLLSSFSTHFLFIRHKRQIKNNG